MMSRWGVACILIAAAASTFAVTTIISAVAAESSDSPTGELGTDPYHAHTGLCKSKNRAHSFADYTIEEQSVCQTICDWNASCAAYEWGAGCYVSSVWGFQAVTYAPSSRARDPRAPAPSPHMTMLMNMTAGRARGTMFSSRKAIRCYLKSRPPAKDENNCAGAGCDDVSDLSASLAIARAKKMRDLMIGSHDIGRWIIPSARDHWDTPRDR